MMKIPYVNLFGWNVDVEKLKLDLLRSGFKSTQKNIEDFLTKISPAVIATASAGISHQTKNFGELREKYRNIENLIQLDEKLIKMGHKSIVEHMYFNFDIELTRYAVEFLEGFRLISPTEKSQRFTVVRPNAFFIPKELKGIPAVKKLIHEEIELYQEALTTIREHLKREYGEEWSKHDGKAKENARYCLSLIVTAPLNFSVNGRELEYIISRANSHELSEIKDLGSKLDKELKKKVPQTKHLMKYTGRDEYYSKNEELEEFVSKMKFKRSKFPYFEFEEGIDDKIIAAILFKHSNVTYRVCLEKAEKMRYKEKEKIVKIFLKKMESWHDAPREFENAYVRFSQPISASCYAQVKRHRIDTLLPQAYDPKLGYYFPEIIKKLKLKKSFERIYDKSSELHEKLKKEGNPGAQYVVTNGHMRNIYVVMNFREVYHFSRLRQDIHAQDEIRFDVANPLCDFMKGEAIVAGMLLGGKNEFPDIRKELYKNE